MQVDYRRLMPITAAVLVVVLALGLSTMYLDVRRSSPARNGYWDAFADGFGFGRGPTPGSDRVVFETSVPVLVEAERVRDARRLCRSSTRTRCRSSPPGTRGGTPPGQPADLPSPLITRARGVPTVDEVVLPRRRSCAARAAVCGRRGRAAPRPSRGSARSRSPTRCRRARRWRRRTHGQRTRCRSGRRLRHLRRRLQIGRGGAAVGGRRERDRDRRSAGRRRRRLRAEPRRGPPRAQASRRARDGRERRGSRGADSRGGMDRGGRWGRRRDAGVRISEIRACGGSIAGLRPVLDVLGPTGTGVVPLLVPPERIPIPPSHHGLGHCAAPASLASCVFALRPTPGGDSSGHSLWSLGIRDEPTQNPHLISIRPLPAWAGRTA